MYHVGFRAPIRTRLNTVSGKTRASVNVLVQYWYPCHDTVIMMPHASEPGLAGFAVVLRQQSTSTKLYFQSSVVKGRLSRDAELELEPSISFSGPALDFSDYHCCTL